MESAGFNDEFDGTNICLVEWPEQAWFTAASRRGNYLRDSD
jgi:tRNA A37 threonylcarbamoyladenosine biosynthesis protein TsaE